jgi:microcystin-dependent protein
LSRNQSGQYTLPLPPVSPGDVVEAQWANQSLGDIGEALTQSLDRNGRGAMLAPLILSSSNPTQALEAVSKAYVESKLVYATGMPVASVCAFASLTAPAGWLKCDGLAVSRTTYSVLFGIIGTTYGVGDGSTTFNLPNLVGEFIRGTPVGRDVGSKQAGSLAAHTHPLSDPGHTHGVSASQAAHSHGITTGSHGHTINDPGHNHNLTVGSADGGGLIAWAQSPGAVFQTAVAGTGISINGVGNLGGNTDAQQPAVTVNIASATTNETVGATGDAETVPQNVAMDYYIKAENDSAGVPNITSITSSDVNMISVDDTMANSPELVIHSNVAFGIPKLDINGKILLAQLPTGSTVLLGYFDASGGANPSQAFPATNYGNGDMYIVSVAGTILVRDPATGVESSAPVGVGGTLLYLEGQSQPDGWYYSTPVAADSAANISFLPEGTISATDVQSAIAELDSETQGQFSSVAASLALKQDAATAVTKDSNTGAASLPAGTTAQRPAGAEGKIRYNSELDVLEGYTNGVWTPLVWKTPAAPAFRASASVAQAVPVSTSQKLLINTKQFDTNLCFNTTTNRFTPTVEGYYQCNVNARIGSALAGLGIAVEFYKNGVSDGSISGAITDTPRLVSVALSSLIYMNGTTDYLEAWVTINGTSGSVNAWGFEFSGSLTRTA